MASAQRRGGQNRHSRGRCWKPGLQGPHEASPGKCFYCHQTDGETEAPRDEVTRPCDTGVLPFALLRAHRGLAPRVTSTEAVTASAPPCPAPPSSVER